MWKGLIMISAFNLKTALFDSTNADTEDKWIEILNEREPRISE